MVFGGITYVLWLGAQAVLAQRMTSGQLSQFLIYAAIVATSAAALTEMWGELQRAAGAMERLAELLAARPGDHGAACARWCCRRACAGDVRSSRSGFATPRAPTRWALQDLSLEVRSGETVAVVGPSGAGKSTSFQLLLRFYDPRARRDPDRRTSDHRSSIRRLCGAQIGFVPQDTVLFGASARENIGYGRPGCERCADRGGGARGRGR